MAPNGRLIASGDAGGTIKLWDIAEGRLLKTVAMGADNGARNTPIYSLGFCQDGKVLASSASDNCVRLWDTEKASVQPSLNSDLLACYPTKQTPIIALKFTPRNILNVVGAFQND
jgi:WD40 repeat protein